jgi:hypothetical protein
MVAIVATGAKRPRRYQEKMDGLVAAMVRRDHRHEGDEEARKTQPPASSSPSLDGHVLAVPTLVPAAVMPHNDELVDSSLLVDPPFLPWPPPLLPPVFGASTSSSSRSLVVAAAAAAFGPSSPSAQGVGVSRHNVHNGHNGHNGHKERLHDSPIIGPMFASSPAHAAGTLQMVLHGDEPTELVALGGSPCMHRSEEDMLNELAMQLTSAAASASSSSLFVSGTANSLFSGPSCP